MLFNVKVIKNPPVTEAVETPSFGLLHVEGTNGGDIVASKAGDSFAMGCEGAVTLRVASGNRVVVSASSLGDVVGPDTSNDNAIALFNGATGKRLRDSGVTIGSIQNSINNKIGPDAFTVKGALLIGTGTGSFVSVPPSITDGHVLTIDSSSGQTGVAWKAGGGGGGIFKYKVTVAGVAGEEAWVMSTVNNSVTVSRAGDTYTIGISSGILIHLSVRYPASVITQGKAIFKIGPPNTSYADFILPAVCCQKESDGNKPTWNTVMTGAPDFNTFALSGLSMGAETYHISLVW